jgi:hypothetical protein
MGRINNIRATVVAFIMRTNISKLRLVQIAFLSFVITICTKFMRRLIILFSWFKGKNWDISL